MHKRCPKVHIDDRLAKARGHGVGLVQAIIIRSTILLTRLTGDYLTIGVAIDRKRCGNFWHNWRLAHIVMLE